MRCSSPSATEYDIDVTELHVAADHVHLYCSFPPRLSISQAVTRLKSLSARTLFRDFPDLRKRMVSGELWEGGYFARTAGDQVTGDIIRRYIRNHRDDQPDQPDQPAQQEKEQEDETQLDLFASP